MFESLIHHIRNAVGLSEGNKAGAIVMEVPNGQARKKKLPNYVPPLNCLIHFTSKALRTAICIALHVMTWMPDKSQTDTERGINKHAMVT